MKSKFLALPFAAIMLFITGVAFADAIPVGNYDVQAAGTNDDYLIVIRTNNTTGDLWYKSGDNWVATSSSAPLPTSNYVFKLVIYKTSGWGMVRIDTVSGQTWVLEGSTWKPVQAPVTQTMPQQTTPEQTTAPNQVTPIQTQ